MSTKGTSIAVSLALGIIGIFLALAVGETSNSDSAAVVAVLAFFALLTWWLTRKLCQPWWLIGLVMCAPLALIFGINVYSDYIAVTRLDQPTEIHGIPCMEVVKYQKNGIIAYCTLSRDYSYSNQVLPSGSRLSFNGDEKPQSCTLSKDTPITGQILPAGSVVSFNRNGSVTDCLLSRDTLIQGHLVRGWGTNFETGFYPDGRLRLGWLAQEEEIQGVPCAPFRFWTNAGVSFHDNGKLTSCRLAKDVTIQGKTFAKGYHLSFDRDGNVDVAHSDNSGRWVPR
jgi:hypothetical protein